MRFILRIGDLSEKEIKNATKGLLNAEHFLRREETDAFHIHKGEKGEEEKICNWKVFPRKITFICRGCRRRDCSKPYR